MKTCEKCGGIDHPAMQAGLHDNCKPLETFGWLTAMKLFADGVWLQEFNLGSWHSFDKDLTDVVFKAHIQYRIKPAPKPDVVEYGYDFKEGHSSWYNSIVEMQYLPASRGIIKKTTKANGDVVLEYIKK